MLITLASHCQKFVKFEKCLYNIIEHLYSSMVIEILDKKSIFILEE